MSEKTIENTLASSTMVQLTSSWTLGIRLFIPVLLLTFLGASTLTVFVLKDSDFVGVFVFPFAKYILLAAWILLAVVMAFTIVRLRRLDGDGEFIYVSTYFRNFRYPHHNIDRLEVKEYGIFHIGRLYFKTPGTLGKKAVCILSKKRLEIYVATYKNIEWPIVE